MARVKNLPPLRKKKNQNREKKENQEKITSESEKGKLGGRKFNIFYDWKSDLLLHNILQIIEKSLNKPSFFGDDFACSRSGFIGFYVFAIVSFQSIIEFN